jgi:hypothetical protein
MSTGAGLLPLPAGIPAARVAFCSDRFQRLARCASRRSRIHRRDSEATNDLTGNAGPRRDHVVRRRVARTDRPTPLSRHPAPSVGCKCCACYNALGLSHRDLFFEERVQHVRLAHGMRAPWHPRRTVYGRERGMDVWKGAESHDRSPSRCAVFRMHPSEGQSPDPSREQLLPGTPATVVSRATQASEGRAIVTPTQRSRRKRKNLPKSRLDSQSTP